MKQSWLMLRTKMIHLSIQMWCISVQYPQICLVLVKWSLHIQTKVQQKACMQKEVVCQERLSRVQYATRHRRSFQRWSLQAINCTTKLTITDRKYTKLITKINKLALVKRKTQTIHKTKPKPTFLHSFISWLWRNCLCVHIIVHNCGTQ